MWRPQGSPRSAPHIGTARGEAFLVTFIYLRLGSTTAGDSSPSSEVDTMAKELPPFDPEWVEACILLHYSAI